MSTHDKARYRSYPRVDFSLAKASDSNVLSYKLFSRKDPDKYVVLSEDNAGKELANKDVKTVLLVHGWTSSDRTVWYELVKEAYFQQNDHNIIYLDWSVYGNMSYDVSSANVKPVGEFVAAFLVKTGVPAHKIHLVGHSLGSQLSSFIGKAYEKLSGRKIGRLTALDPAGPLWSNQNMNKEERLNELDADFVDVVHTDVQLFGFTLPCGHVDFYPNGGTNQPGCPDAEQNGNCNHHRATRFFVESINTKVTATEIDIQEDEEYNVIIKHKNNLNEVIFGEHVDPKARGVFHFETSHEGPFLGDINSN